eukprot:3427602-Pyramimonas_sp.AAC.1
MDNSIARRASMPKLPRGHADAESGGDGPVLLLLVGRLERLEHPLARLEADHQKLQHLADPRPA